MDFRIARQNMVRSQITGRGIRDTRIIAALIEVPRHLFVDPGMQSSAYSDNALPIYQGQTISQPYMVAIMTEQLDVKTSDKILEIGTGSGYQAAILSRLSKQVYSIERHPELAERALKNLAAAGIENVKIFCGDGTLGWPEEAPFDKIIITAGAPSIPQTLMDQLSEGGRMVIPVGNRHIQSLQVVDKINNKPEVRQSIDCVFVPLVGKQGWSDVT